MYVVGGRSNAHLHYDLEIYDPSTNMWACSPRPGRSQACVPGTRLLGCAAGAIGHRIVFAGGEHSDRKMSVIVSHAETHDVTSGEIEKLTPLAVPRTKCQSVVINGKFLVFGGCTKPEPRTTLEQNKSFSPGGAHRSAGTGCHDGCDMKGVEGFDPTSGCWTAFRSMPVSRYSGCASFVEQVPLLTSASMHHCRR
jgi:hypothetical protein